MRCCAFEGGIIKMGQYKRLWIILGLVVATDGRVLFNDETIRDGQNVWQSIGGQQVGSVFGHGAYVAPDWTADWLHREAVYTLDAWARETGAKDFEALAVEEQAS